MLNQLGIQQRIRAERNAIQREGQRLGGLKEAAINNNQQLPPDYAIQLLRLINRIVEHDIACRNQYGVDQARMRRSNLGNLAITARLFTDYNNLIPNNILPNYKSGVPGYDGTNIFNDLAHLRLFDIFIYDNPFSGPLYHMADNQVDAILDEICPVLMEIANAEVNAYNNNPPQNLNNIRLYRSRTNLPQLFMLISFHKETTHISNSIRAIDSWVGINSNPNAPDILANKRALLRCLSIVGEAFTQPNLTPATRSISILSQQELKCFKRIRDICGHLEQPANLGRVENFIQNHHDIGPIINDLRLLRALLDLIRQDLIVKSNHNSLGLHYLPVDRPNQSPMARFPMIRNILGAQAQANQVNFGDLINNELQAIDALLNGAPGVETLRDHHLENVHFAIMPRQNYNVFMNTVLQRIQILNNQGANIPTPNFNGIIPVGDDVRLELPQAILNNLFQNNNQQEVDYYLNQNLHAVADALIRYENKLRFIGFLQQNPVIKLNVEYHIVRLSGFISRMHPNELTPEIRVFRNIVAHDLNDVLITGSPAESFICRYLAMIVQIFPQQQGQQQMPPGLGVI